MTNKVVQFKKLDDVEQCLEDAKSMNYDGVVVVGVQMDEDMETINVSGHIPKGMSKPHVRGIIQEAQDILFHD